MPFANLLLQSINPTVYSFGDVSPVVNHFSFNLSIPFLIIYLTYATNVINCACDKTFRKLASCLRLVELMFS